MKKFTVSWNNTGLYYRSLWLSCTPKSERPHMECICFKALDSGHSPLNGSASLKFWGRDFKTFFKNSFLLKLISLMKFGSYVFTLLALDFLFSLQFSRKIFKLLFKVFMFQLHVLKDDRQSDRQTQTGIEVSKGRRYLWYEEDPHLMPGHDHHCTRYYMYDEKYAV